MKRVGLLSALIFLCLSLLTYAVQTEQKGSAVPDVLERQVTPVNSEFVTTHSSFLESLVSARVPGGIVTILNCEHEQPRKRTDLFPGPLKEALDAIVKADPQYLWQVDDRVINLRPLHDEPALLNVRINKLDVENASSVDAVVDKLFDLPEVKEAITKLQLSPGVHLIVGPVSFNPERLQKFSIECENVTVREALNAIVRAHGRSLWEYKEQHCNGKTIYNVDIIGTWLKSS
jgi:hypothetical protein